jgi:hypothetical protein
MDQLEIYAALFYLEYRLDPNEFSTVLRIYQSDEIIEEIADPSVLVDLMDQIVYFDKILNDIDEEEARS